MISPFHASNTTSELNWKVTFQTGVACSMLILSIALAPPDHPFFSTQEQGSAKHAARQRERASAWGRPGSLSKDRARTNNRNTTKQSLTWYSSRAILPLLRSTGLRPGRLWWLVSRKVCLLLLLLPLIVPIVRSSGEACGLTVDSALALSNKITLTTR